MNTLPAPWYVQGEHDEPLGPFTPEEMLEFWRSRRFDINLLCWQAGMADWLPLVTLEPFASRRLEERRAARQRRLRLLTIGPAVTVVLVIVAGVGYLWWQEWATVAQARQAIAAQQYEDAVRSLQPLAKQGHFFGRRAHYWLAVGTLRQFAAGAEGVNGDRLNEAKKQLERLCASASWRAEATSELVGILATVPRQAPQALERCRQLAQLLVDLQLAERASLTRELLDKAKEIWADPQAGPQEGDGDAVAWMLQEDAALVEPILTALVLDAAYDEPHFERGVACLDHWGHHQPALAGLLVPGLAKGADRLVADGPLERPHRLMVTAKRIDTQFDTWRYWDKHFPKTDGASALETLKILTFMVEGEQDPQRLKEATDRYCRWRQRHPGVNLPPPPEIRERFAEVRFRELFAEAEQSLKKGRYQEAEATVGEMRHRYSAFWSKNADADRLDQDVQFHLQCEEARQTLEKGDPAAALGVLNEAMRTRPEDQEAGELRNAIQAALDRGEFEQQRRQAEEALAATDLRVAVEKLVAARSVMDRPGNAVWAPSCRGGLEELSQTLLGKLREQAESLSGKRQYQEAEAAVALGSQLSPNDAQLSELLAKIKSLKSDPKTANLSGTWVCREDGKVLEMTLADNGSDAVTWKLPARPGGQEKESSGEFTRAGVGLEGRRPLELDGMSGQLTVKARIESPDTIVVLSSLFVVSNSHQPPRRDNAPHTWTRQGAGAR